jgi:hypothetical protein
MDGRRTRSGPGSTGARVPVAARPVEWFLVDGDRLLVSALLLVGVAVVTYGVVLSGIAPLTGRTPVLFLLFALVGGNFTLITIVVSISQFVLARHLESPGEIRDRMEEIVGYRAAVGEVTREQTIPVTPAGFLRLLFRSIVRDAADLDAALDDGLPPASDEELAQAVSDLMADVAVHARHVVDLLEGGDRGTRAALFATLNTDYARYFSEAYRIRGAYGEDLPGSVAETLDGLERHVEQIDVARRYFKTVFIQSELSVLTRLLLYIGPPVQIVSVVLMLLYTKPGQLWLSERALALVLPAVVTAGFAPFALLTSYILRLATVVERTALMYPFSATAP